MYFRGDSDGGQTCPAESIRQFFTYSESLDYEVLRPLSHIRPYWELRIAPSTPGLYYEEEDSFGGVLNALIEELCLIRPAVHYHDSEDCLAEQVKKTINWQIKKVGRVWVNADGSRLEPRSYLSLLEQGGFSKSGISNLVSAAAGRICAAIVREQVCFDDMERSHRVMLAGVLSIILYHREFE